MQENEFTSGDFLGLLFLFIVILAVWIVRVYNKLKLFTHMLKEHEADLNTIIRKKLMFINQVSVVINAYRESNSLKELKISEYEATPVKNLDSYQKSFKVLTEIYGFAQNDRALANSKQYYSLRDDIEECENDIVAKRDTYNYTIQLYNIYRSKFPIVLVSNLFLFKEKAYATFEFTSSEPESDRIKDLKEFEDETMSDERIDKLLADLGINNK